MGALLNISDLSVEYDGTPVLQHISLSVESGRIYGVVGESGSGKSTAIYSILGILEGGRITSGTIAYQGTNVALLSAEQMREVRGNNIALIAQNPLESFHPTRKIRKQLYELVRCHEGISTKVAEQRMLDLMAKFNLPNGERILDSYAFELSGGMCQRASIALAMSLRPSLLLADEPTSALDAVTQKQVVDELVKVRDEFGTAVLIVSHNMGVISYLADDVLVMYAGHIVEYGSKHQVITNPQHPYTRNLIAAIARMDAPAPRGVKTVMQDRQANNCPYHDGCEDRTDACMHVLPEFVEVEPGHLVRCRACDTSADGGDGYGRA